MRRRILFCADGYAVHTHAWLRLLEGTDWDVHVFVGGDVPPLPLGGTFHTLDAKAENPVGNRVRPFWPLRRGVTQVCRWRFGGGPEVESKRLASLIRKLRPSIVHSLRMQDEGYRVLGASAAVREVGATWIVSLWGSDLHYFAAELGHRQRIRRVLRACNYITADCRRDLRLSRELGAEAGQLFYAEPIAGNGGVDVQDLCSRLREHDPAQRRIVLFPKAREDRFHRFLPVLEALVDCEAHLRDYTFVFLRTDERSRRQIDTLPISLVRRCEVHTTLPRDQALDLVAAARIVAAPSVSDGTPNVMLESMAVGALPILSPLESIREWITDGHNGLLADNEDRRRLSQALRRAAHDDDLVRQAAHTNRALVSARADRRVVRGRVLSMYEQLSEPRDSTASRPRSPRAVTMEPAQT